MTDLFFENGHLSDAGLQALINGTLDELQRLEAAEHLSFCDECLTRYTNLLTDDIQLEPQQNVTLPVMRKLRTKATKQMLNRYTAAVAAVFVTGALWYSGVFAGVMDSININDANQVIEPPSITQTKPETAEEPTGQFSQLWGAFNQWISGNEPRNFEQHPQNSDSSHKHRLFSWLMPGSNRS